MKKTAKLTYKQCQELEALFEKVSVAKSAFRYASELVNSAEKKLWKRLFFYVPEAKHPATFNNETREVSWTEEIKDKIT
jgi:hypothetical protein